MENPLEIRVVKVVEDGRNSPFLRWENQPPKARCQAQWLFSGRVVGSTLLGMICLCGLRGTYRLPRNSLKLNMGAMRVGQAIRLWPMAPSYKARKPPQK